MDEKFKKVAYTIEVITAEAVRLCYELTRVGVSAAEAGKNLRVAMIKIARRRQGIKNISYKKMLRSTPKRKRSYFMERTKVWEKNSGSSRYKTVFNRSDGKIFITQWPLPII